MKCFKATVKTTNSSDDTFELDEQYYACDERFVYIAAPDICDAAKQLPCAVSIEEVGVFFDGKKNES